MSLISIRKVKPDPDNVFVLTITVPTEELFKRFIFPEMGLDFLRATRTELQDGMIEYKFATMSEENERMMKEIIRQIGFRKYMNNNN